jgi:hypothetical protein
MTAMDYRSISKILPVSFASIGYWIRNFAKEYKSKTGIMEAISNLDESSREASGKAKGSQYRFVKGYRLFGGGTGKPRS